MKGQFIFLLRKLRNIFTFHSQPPLPSPESLPSFHYFGLLPTELRLQIWDLAIPQPRLVFIKSSTRYIPPKDVERHGRTDPVAFFKLQRLKADMTVELCYGVPASLQACSESRERAMRVYEKAWERGEGVCVHGIDEIESGELEKERRELGWRYTWVNYCLDLIVFDHF